MPTDLRETIRTLSPGALRLFKQQLASLSDKDRQVAYQRLQSVPELSDIIGRPPQEDVIGKLPAQPEPQKVVARQPQNYEWWQYPLGAIGKPFEGVSKHVTEPFGAYATAPFTPAVAGTEQMNPFERERAEYEQWKEPEFTMPWGGKFRPTKGIVEMLPWLALPSAGTIASRLGMMAKGAGGLARGAGIAEKIIKPIASVEALPGKIVGKVAGKATEKIIPKVEQVTSELFPEGFSPTQQTAIKWLTDFAKKLKPLRAETEELYKAGRATQAKAYEEAVEKLTAQGMAPKEALAEARKALYMGGELPKAPIPAGVATTAEREAEAMGQELFGIIRDAPYKSAFDRVNINEALTRLLDPKVAGLPRDFEFKLLERTFGSDLVKELLKKRPWGVRAWELTLDIANAPRALLASCDISGLLRQGGVLTARHPLESAKTVAPMVNSLFSDKNALLQEAIIRARPGMDELVDEALRVPLFQSPLPTKVAVQLGEREEAFMSNFLNKLGVIKGSNRAYVTGLNDLRSRSALNTLNSWKKARITYTKEDVSDLNQLVNWASGRGTLPQAISKQGAVLNTMFFAPKLIMSRLQLPTTVLPMVTKSKLVRDEAWRTLLSFIGSGAGILTMAQLAGQGKTELDPRSADFAKMRFGETRMDIWTGYTQYIRFLAQLATAQRKTAGGRIQQLNRGEVIKRFAQTKFSPAVGLINDLLAGETYLGEELPPKSAKGVLGQLYQRMMPLAIQDLIDGVNQDGILGGVASVYGFVGVGIATYTDEAKKERDKAAQKQYGMTWDEVGRQYGRAEQLRLEQTTPAILEAEKEQEKRFATGTPTTMSQWQNEGKAVEDTYREAINLASKEFRATRDGATFRDKVDSASSYRRQAYSSRAKRKEYQDIVAYYNQPIPPDKVAQMNPGDVLRREYYQQMFALDMYDQFGNYLFDEAERREQKFLAKNGQQALDYIEDYSAARWVDKPPELQMLEQARDLLRPYWQIEDNIWNMYPPELKAVADQIKIMERTDPERARQFLKSYPAILRARELIATYKKQMRDYNPAIKSAYRTFYG